jgi:hypothetical protein
MELAFNSHLFTNTRQYGASETSGETTLREENNIKGRVKVTLILFHFFFHTVTFELKFLVLENKFKSKSLFDK